jgi:ATP-dependent Clp protease ATP-binding subunit ClpC
LRLSIASQIAFTLAAAEAKNLNSENIDVEHFFLGLCKIDDILYQAPDSFGIIPDRWTEVVSEVLVLSKKLKRAGLDLKKGRRWLREILNNTREKGIFSGHRTSRCREVFSNAERMAMEQGSGQITLLHCLLAILKEASEEINILFRELDVDRDSLLIPFMDIEKEINPSPDQKTPAIKKTPATPFLDKNGRDLTQLALQNVLEPAFGREKEIHKLARVLMQKKKNNPILVGEAGVGKTAIVEALAQFIISSKAPRQLKDVRIVELEMNNLVAGTKYRGEFEERLEKVLKEASADPNLVLFIDEIHTLVGAGAAEGALDAANILKPALSKGSIKCIGATTPTEYRKSIEKDPALERRFQVVWVDEPTPEQALVILKGIAPKFEKHHGVKVPEAVLAKAVEFSIRYLPDFRLPDKAIDLIDQACTIKLLKTIPNIQEEVGEELSLSDLARVVSERCRIPLQDLTEDETIRLLHMEEYLSKRIMGQDNAIKEVAESIRTARVGLKEPNRPMAVFLFVGPTGSGKTELAKSLAAFLFHDEKKLIQFDMSEYQEKHSLSKLIGAPPGYLGHEQEGQLTGSVRRNPYSIVLFDEVEKAHPDILKIFLQIFDEGHLTDSQGKKTSFKNTIIILTSNLGASLQPFSKQEPIGIILDSCDKKPTYAADTRDDSDKKCNDQYMAAVEKYFSPELFNRISKIITFNPLSEEAMKQILYKILDKINKLLEEKHVRICLLNRAEQLLIEVGFSKAYGAREMERVFSKLVSEPVARMILEGQCGGLDPDIYVDAADGKIKFS